MMVGSGSAPLAGALPAGVIFDRGSPSHRAVIDDMRFVGLCAKIGLCDYWVTSGYWPDCADEVPYDFRAEARRLADQRD